MSDAPIINFEEDEVELETLFTDASIEADIEEELEEIMAFGINSPYHQNRAIIQSSHGNMMILDTFLQ
jgi:hypothetical protein